MIDPITLLKETVAIKSLSREEEEVANYLVAQMNGLGFDKAFVDEGGNAVGVRENGVVEREIIMLGHMDTVPGDIPVRIEDGILHGRGSVDAKGPLVTFIMATAQAEIPEGVRLIVIGATEEESATSRGARHAAKTYSPDFCIIGEPSNWDAVTLGYKGRVLVDYHYAQDMSHTAGSEAGAAESGIIWYNKVMAYIEQFNEENPKLFDQLLPSIRDIETKSDGLQNSIYMKIGVRLPPNFDIPQFEQQLQVWAGEAKITCYGQEVAYSSSRSNPLARTFSRALLQHGVKPRFKLKTGTADMNVVGPVWNCPIVAYGPGDSTLDHTPQEHIVLDDYLKAIDILKTVLESL